MSKGRKRKPPKTGPVWTVSALEATLATKPRYNGYSCGYGPHGDTKYNRVKENRVWKDEYLNPNNE